MRIGLIGASGYWGRKILFLLDKIEGGELKVCSAKSNLDTLNNIISTYFCNKEKKDLVLTSDYSEIITSANIDAVIITTPAETHYSVAKQALLNGKHVFIEKPLCLNSRDVKELIKIAKMQGRILFTDHTYLHSKCINYLKTKIEEGCIGDPLFLYSNRSQMGIYRNHNVIWDLCPHDLSILFFLL